MCFNVFSYYFDVPEIVSKGPKRNSSVQHIRILINISVYITFNSRTSAKYVPYLIANKTERITSNTVIN
jgi:hypothetical protein